MSTANSSKRAFLQDFDSCQCMNPHGCNPNQQNSIQSHATSPKRLLSNRQQHTGNHLLCFFTAFRIGASFWVHPFHLDFEPELVQRDDRPSKVLRRVYRPAGRMESKLFFNVTSLSWIFKYLGKLVKKPDLKKLGLEIPFQRDIIYVINIINIISIIVIITTTLTWKKESGQPATPEVLFVVFRRLLPRQSCNYALIPRLASFQEACPSNLLKQRGAGEQLQDF